MMKFKQSLHKKRKKKKKEIGLAKSEETKHEIKITVLVS
jgi:hypothetical protein